MSILQRYIAKMVVASTALVLVVMLGLTFIINFLEELRDVGSGDYGLPQALFHVVYELPHALYQFFPMLVLMGGILGLGILASSRELLVMRTSGFSLKRIYAATLIAAAILTIAATIIGECFAPKMYFIAESHKESEQNGGQAIATFTGVWLHENNNFIHITRVMGVEHLDGVTRYQFDQNHQLLAAYYVKTMDLVNGQWQLHNLVKTTFSHQQTVSQSYPEATWDLVLSPNLLNVGVREPSAMSLSGLRQYEKHFTENGLRAASFSWEFWKRIFQPFTTIVMILLAIPFVMNTSRTATMGLRVLFGISVGFIFYILNALLGQVSIVFQISAIYAAVFPLLLFAGVSYLMTLKLRA